MEEIGHWRTRSRLTAGYSGRYVDEEYGAAFLSSPRPANGRLKVIGFDG
jgi:hypothetical protein